jgi:hypothetical protein
MTDIARSGGPGAARCFLQHGEARLRRRGYVRSVEGVATFTKWPVVSATVASVNADDILLETDAPFLAPHPFGGPNGPYLLAHTLLTVAELQALKHAQLCAATRPNGEHNVRRTPHVNHMSASALVLWTPYPTVANFTRPTGGRKGGSEDGNQRT